VTLYTHSIKRRAVSPRQLSCLLLSFIWW